MPLRCLVVLDIEKFTGYRIELPLYLDPCDFFLWGYIKGRIYRNPPDSLEDPESIIRSEINALNSNTVHRIMTEFQNWLHNTIVGNSRRFKNLLY